VLRYGVHRSTFYVLFVFLSIRVVILRGRGIILVCRQEITRTKRKLLEVMQQILAVHTYILCGPFLFKTLDSCLVGGYDFTYHNGTLESDMTQLREEYRCELHQPHLQIFYSKLRLLHLVVIKKFNNVHRLIN
jgi:hypothetical protein